MGIRRLGAVALAVSVVACSIEEASRVDTAESAHTEGDLAWNNEPFLWADVDRASFDKLYRQPSAPAADPIAVRLQAWVDRYDALVRAVVREKTGQTLVAPKPTIRLLTSAAVVAEIRFTETCLVDATADGDARAPLGDPVTTVMTRPDRSSTAFLTKCFRSKGWPGETASIDWFNRLGGYQLRKENGKIRFLDERSIARETDIVAVSSAFPFVTVSAGLVANVSEKAAAATIAHELGHYYRSHGSTSIEGKYDYWYDRDRQTAERPTPVANQAEYAKQYGTLRAPRFRVVGQQVHPRVADSMLAWANALRVKPGHACEPLQKAVASLSDDVRASFFSVLSRNLELTGAGKIAYLDIEAKMLTCAANVKLTDDAAGPAGTVFQTNDIPRAFFVERLAQPFTELSSSELNQPTLARLLEVLTTKATALDDARPEFSKRLEQNKIGHYTGEQEADELAMELGARIGLSPDETLAGFFELSKAIETTGNRAEFVEQNNGMTTAECETLYRAGFKNGDKDAYVPLGNLDDPHHAFCYRIFNLSRERAAHAYIVAAPSYPAAIAPWAGLQARARALAAGTPPEPTSPSGDAAPGDSPAAPPSVEPPSSPGTPPSSPNAAPESSAVPDGTVGAGCSAAPVRAAAGGNRTVAGGIGIVLALLTALRRRRSR